MIYVIKDAFDFCVENRVLRKIKEAGRPVRKLVRFPPCFMTVALTRGCGNKDQRTAAGHLM